MTIASELIVLNNTKTAIKAAIEAKGVVVGAVPFSQYPAKIAGIETGSPIDSLVWSQQLYEQVFAAGPGSWSRSEWLPLTGVSGTDEKFVGLHAVYKEPEGNFCALTAMGDYTVDWGDGTVENFASTALASHVFDYTNVAFAGTNFPLTFDGSDVISRVSHGFANGKKIQFYDLVTTTGISEGITYFVVNAAADTFQVSATLGGAPLALTGAGSATLLPYKQVIVTVTPQAGQSLTKIDLNKKNELIVTSQTYDTGWLDILLGSPNFTEFNVFQVNGGAVIVTKKKIERVRVTNLGAITSMSAAFSSMTALVVVELPDTSLVTDFMSAFSGCPALETVPLFDTSNALIATHMFSSCYSLKTIPLFDTSSVTTMSFMFANSNALMVVPHLDTSSVTSFASTFSGCLLLRTVPLFDTSSATSMVSMFNVCRNLQEVPLFDTSSVLSMLTMFNACAALHTVPAFNSALATEMTSMFSGCSSLKIAPLLNTASLITMGSMFTNCTCLQTIPALDLSNVTTFTSAFSNCTSLSRLMATGMKNTFSVSGCKLSAAALDEIYSNLAVVTAKSITVTSNYGTSGDDPTIATAKGWTVTGS